jgi:AraC-like DNA-binding protein
MLSSALLLDTPYFRVRDVVCAHRRGPWAAVEVSSRSAIVFARHGAFRRRGRFGEEVIEPGVAYFQRAGEEEEFAHPHHGGDRCTSIAVADTMLASLLGGDPTLPAGLASCPRRGLRNTDNSVDEGRSGVGPSALARGHAAGAAHAAGDLAAPLGQAAGAAGDLAAAALATRPVPTSPHLDLTHRVLAARREHTAAAEERALGLVASVLATVAPKRVAAGRPATAHARRRAADDAREALAADPSLTLAELARLVAISPHHLSRVFRDEVGVTVSTYRRRLRVRAALERLDGGESNLARLAADAGFADHAHLTRELRASLGITPSQLRAQLS